MPVYVIVSGFNLMPIGVLMLGARFAGERSDKQALVSYGQIVA